ncbi:MAG: hypothetical protein GY898_18465, partial [Proteobacteria bacterium]|nr:hypothetical protein [Pseudomonadota bacterium]
MTVRQLRWVLPAVLLFACATPTEPEPEQCPTANESFESGCEPAVPACAPDLDARSAASYRGTFGSLDEAGACQSDWPEPYLAACTEPLPEGVPDLRGLWADEGHVERVEQCGDLVIIVGDHYTHGGYATGVVDDGVNDFAADGTCSTPISVALVYEGDELQFRLGGDSPIVTRRLEVAEDGEDELVWRFGPGLPERARMRRHCGLGDVPATA